MSGSVVIATAADTPARCRARQAAPDIVQAIPGSGSRFLLGQQTRTVRTSEGEGIDRCSARSIFPTCGHLATVGAVPPSPEIVHDLRVAYATGDLVIFAGAGIAAAGGLPTWPKLALDLRDRLQREGKPADVLGEVDELIKQRQFIDGLSAVKHALGAPEFDLAVEKALDDSTFPVPDVAKAIAKLEPKLRAVLTTNLDRFLERAFAGNWDALTDPPSNLGHRTRYILKLHGTRIDRRTWVFTREQYDQATFGWSQQRSVFEALFRSHPILFVGYGLADDDFDQTLSATRALAGPNPPHHFALLPAPVGPYRRSKLEKAGLRLLVYDDHADVPRILNSIP